MTQDEDVLRGVPLLARLPHQDRQALTSQGQVRSYPAGTAIVEEDDPGDSLHIIIEGSVRITTLSPDGQEATLALLERGECFGELSLLDGRPRSASAIASKATKTLVVTREHFIQWLFERPQAALTLLETMSLRLRRTDAAISDLVFLDLPQRLARRLLDLATSPLAMQVTTPPVLEVRLRMTQEELASMLGVSRESINKELNLLARRGWIGLGRGSVTLKDMNALRALVESQ